MSIVSFVIDSSWRMRTAISAASSTAMKLASRVPSPKIIATPFLAMSPPIIGTQMSMNAVGRSITQGTPQFFTIVSMRSFTRKKSTGESAPPVPRAET